MLGRFLEPLLAAWHRAHLTRQADFTEHQQIMGQRTITQAGHHGGHQRQVRCGFQHLDPAHHVQENILIVGWNTAVSVQYGQ